MTARQRRRYWIVERNKTIRYINKYTPIVAGVLRRDYDRFADAVEAGQGRAFAETFVVDMEMADVLREIYETIGPRYAARAFREDTVKFFVPEEWVNAIMDWLGVEFYNKGVLIITNTTKDHFLKILGDALLEGLGVREIANRIRRDESIDAEIQRRALMIARTETGSAIHTGQMVGADRSPFLKQKTWISAKDARTRRNPKQQPSKADHWLLDNQTVPVQAMFTDPTTGHQLMHPHDKVNGRAVDVINCRCTFAVTNIRDAEGRLVRKPAASVQNVGSRVVDANLIQF